MAWNKRAVSVNTQQLHHFAFPPTVHKVSNSPPSLPIYFLISWEYPFQWLWNDFPKDLICMFPSSYLCWAFVDVLIGHVFFFLKKLSNSTHVLIELCCWLKNILDSNSLSELPWIFFPLLWSVFSFLAVPFWEKMLSFDEVHLTYYFSILLLITTYKHNYLTYKSFCCSCFHFAKLGIEPKILCLPGKHYLWALCPLLKYESYQHKKVIETQWNNKIIEHNKIIKVSETQSKNNL